MADHPLLHFLRPFSGWRYRMGPDKGKPIDTVEDAIEWVNMIRNAGFDAFSTTTARRPRRMIELPLEYWGSVYFVQRKHTVFRMPISAIADMELETDIIMRPTIHRCEAKHVGMVRGLIVFILALLASCHLPKILEPQDCECATEESE